MSFPYEADFQKTVSEQKVLQDALADFMKKNVRTAFAASKNNHACGNCLKESDQVGKSLQACSQCHTMWYCSRECQKAHWPTHKQACTKFNGKKIDTLITAFMVNPILHGYLAACLCLDFDMLNRPKPESIPYMARVDVGIEPRDLLDFYRIFDGEDPQVIIKEHGGRVPGLVQINGITPYPITGPRLTQNRYDIWQRQRDKLTSEGKGHHPVVVVEFIYQDHTMVILHCVEISDPVVKIVKAKEPFRSVSRRFGPIERPFNSTNCLTFLNHCLRGDNKLTLKREATKDDLETVRNAGKASQSAEPPAKDSVKSLLNKMQYDPYYKRFPDSYVKV